MSIDAFYSKKYNADTYNCAHFVVDVWKHLTGLDIRQKMEGFLLPAKDRKAYVAIKNDFELLKKPVSPCIALMTSPRKQSHVGIYFNGRIFHIGRTRVEYMPIPVASILFKRVSFYKC